MKQKLLAGCAGLVLALGPSALGQDASWENWGQILVPSEAYPYAPQIDAYNFINHRGASIQISGTSLYDTSSTTNYVNEGIMTAFPGFDFRTYPNNMGTGRPAASFANLYSGPGTGEINCFGTLFYGGVPGLFFGNLSGNSKISVVAENITNSGNINLSAGSLLELKGKNINLTRGGLNMANTTSRILFGTNTVYNGINLLFNAGILDGYWGAETATNGISPAAYFGNNAITPLHWATTRDYLTLGTSLFGPVAYVNDSGAINSNRFVQAVFLYNFDPEFVNSVFFTPFQIVVQWRWTTPRWPDMSIVDTNYFFVTDNFGEVTNIGLRVNGYINPQSLYPTPTYIPVNYQFYQGAPYSTILTPATPGMLPGAFDAGLITNQYIAYQGIFTAGTALPTDIAGGAYSNMPGRIEISATNSLNLSRARISTLNYLRLEALDNFQGSQNAVISTPYADYNLRTSSGSLTVSNLIAPFVAHPAGICDLYSARWTNVVNNITNRYHVLFAMSSLEPVTHPQISNLKLRVDRPNDNLIINDILNVTASMDLRATRLTIATNDSRSYSTNGQLNLHTTGIVWPTATRDLKYLTNYGQIGMMNAVYFGGPITIQTNGNWQTITNTYEAMVNRGTITNQGSLVWARHFENSGTFEAGQGSITLQNCTNAILTDGTMDARFGRVSLYADSLRVSNHMILSGGAIDLAITNSITDGGAGQFNGNLWTVGSGFNLLSKPANATGDLLATTVTCTAPDYAENLNLWAGQDRRRTVLGFTNNVAIGRLLLTGGVDSRFRFVGTGTSNAIYVDYLELRGSTTNRDMYGNFPALDIDPGNMMIYFADAVANGVSIAEKLHGRNGGRLSWVSSYAGSYSSTNLVYPDGSTNTFNRALVQSTSIDSDGDGIVNHDDPTPIFVSGLVKLSITLTNQPPGAKLLTWPTLGNSTNSLYYTSFPNGTNWQLLTNFVFGPNDGQAAVLDTTTSSTRYYRVRVDAGQR